MRYSGIIYNDFSSAPGVCLSFFTQGCPFHCKGCHNQETWDFEGGKEFTPQILESIIAGLQANNINRDLCIMGGEPLCQDNLFLTHLVIESVKKALPNTKVYIWTGYQYEDLLKVSDSHMKRILELADCIVDGPYKEEERDITLPMRGSRNQRVIYLHETV